MSTKIALMGAGGKMGQRITRNLIAHDDFELRYVEVSDAGAAELRERFGVETTPEAEAVAGADVVILALPDRLIGKVSHALFPKLDPGTIVVGLDPAAAYAGVMPETEGVSVFVTHPCHTPLFHDETSEEAKNDWFGGVHAAQHIVCALHSGPEEHYTVGEKVAKAMYAPVIESHRITVEHMALLEPALVETFSAALLVAVREGLEEVVKMGVPRPAAEAFLYGHLRTELAIVFGFAGFPFSDGAKLAIEKAQSRIFQPDWKERVFALENVKASVKEITEHLDG